MGKSAKTATKKGATKKPPKRGDINLANRMAETGAQMGRAGRGGY